MPDLSDLADFMDEAGDDDEAKGFRTPRIPSVAHPLGRQYQVPAPDALTGLRLNALADMTLKATRGVDLTETDVRRLRLDDQEEREFLAMVLGSAFDEMIADRVSWPHLQRMGTYTFLRYGISKEAADGAVANGLLRGKLAAPTNRAGRRKRAKKTGSA